MSKTLKKLQIHGTVYMVTHVEPSEFRIYHPINLTSDVYKVSSITLAVPLSETVKGHEPPGPG